MRLIWVGKIKSKYYSKAILKTQSVGWNSEAFSDIKPGVFVDGGKRFAIPPLFLENSLLYRIAKHMNENLTQHLNQLKSKTILDEELSWLLSILNMETVKEEKKSSFDYLLQRLELTPGQAVLIASCDPVQYSIDLQYSLKRYIKDRKYKEAEKNEGRSSDWIYALSLLSGSFGGGC